MSASVFQLSYLSALGKRNPKECVRYMLKNIGTSQLWSSYSYKGLRGRKPLVKNTEMTKAILSK